MGPSINKFKGWESMDWSSIRKSRDMKLGMGLAPWLVVWVWGSWWVGSGGVRWVGSGGLRGILAQKVPRRGTFRASLNTVSYSR